MLAIVIPYYKLTFFDETLKSLANQTNKGFKVYIGDDASPENPIYLLEQYKGSFDFEYHRFDSNLGGISLTKQWERCISLSKKEEWLMVLGDDDYLSDNVVEKFHSNLENINKEKIKVIKFSSQLIDANGSSISDIFTHPKIEKHTDAYYKNFIGDSRSSLSEYIFNISSFQQFGFTNYPLAWHSDDKAWLDFSISGYLYSINEAKVLIRMSSENISGNRDNLYLKRKARLFFLEDIIFKKKYNFTNVQKKSFLFEYGVLIKELDKVTISNVSLVFVKLIFMGCFYDSIRFLRRIYFIK